MKYLKYLLICAGCMLAALTSAAEECPYLLPGRLYKCTYMVMDNRKAPMKAFITQLTTPDGAPTVIIDGIGEDHDLDFTIHLNDDWLRTSVDGQTVYIAPDSDGKNVIISDWTEGAKIIFFKFASETLGIAFIPTPFKY